MSSSTNTGSGNTGSNTGTTNTGGSSTAMADNGSLYNQAANLIAKGSTDEKVGAAYGRDNLDNIKDMGFGQSVHVGNKKEFWGNPTGSTSNGQERTFYASGNWKDNLPPDPKGP